MSDKGFLVELVQVFEYSEAPPYDNIKSEGAITLGYFFTIDENKENVEKRIREHLPPTITNSKKYNIIVREVQNLSGIYKLGKLDEENV